MHRPYTHAFTLALQHCTAGAGHRPLGTGRPLTAILQRKAELPLAGAKMAGGPCHTALGPGINQHSPHTQGQRHGGACAIQSNGRNVQILNGKSRGGLGQFKGLLPHGGIGKHCVKVSAQGAFPLFFTCHAGVTGDHRRICKGDGLSFFVHKKTPRI